MRQRRRQVPDKRAAANPRLEDVIDAEHPLVRLSSGMDWQLLAGHFGQLDRHSTVDSSMARLIVGLSSLKQLYPLDDEQLLERWLENPYFQYFCGEKYFQHRFAFDRAAILKNLQRTDAEKAHAAVRVSLSTAIIAASIKLSDLANLGGVDADRFKSEFAAVEQQEISRQRSGAEEPQRPVSIYDVAERAGVSIKTVSLVINRQPNVSLQTRTAVTAAIKALSYRPNVFARGLASERSYLIGMLYDNAPGSYIADLQYGALDRCREEGYHLIVELLPPQDANPRQRVRSLVSESVLHGVILTPPLCDVPEVIDELTASKTPFVRIAPGTKILGTPSIGIDEFKAAYEMTSYLISLGHQRIGFVKGIPTHFASLARLDGYRAALADAGLPFTEELCARGMFSYQSGLAAGEHLLTLKQRPTAIFAGNDDMAAGILAVSQRFHLKVPEQLSLAGFDDSLVAQVVWPRLTTCRQPIRDMAATAVSILAQGDRSGSPEHHLAHEIVVRESTAPPQD